MMNRVIEKLGQEHIKWLGRNKEKKLVLIVFCREIRAPCEFFSISFLVNEINNNLIIYFEMEEMQYVI